MDIRSHGFTRRQIREGGGTGEGVASEHFDELIGSTEFYIYHHQNRKIKGYEGLKLFLESEGCEVFHMLDAPSPVGKGFETIRITHKGRPISTPSLRRAHNWAHQRNLLHLFHRSR